ncbi:MAG: SprB repeat-containing protein, partial [Bacteroidetes bacterium]|nr:SprB repeat-containing protein [Bacteroidota bacterium]
PDIYDVSHPNNLSGTLGTGRLDVEAALKCLGVNCDQNPIAVIMPSSEKLCLSENVILTANPGTANPGTTSLGITYSWSDGSTTQSITKGTGGIYSVTVHIDDGTTTCDPSTSFELIEVNATQAKLVFVEKSSIINDGIICGNGIVEATAFPGLGFEWEYNGQPLIPEDGILPSSPSHIKSEEPPFTGNWSVTVSDVGGCTGVTSVVTATSEWVSPPSISLISTTEERCIGACDGKVVVTTDGGTSPYTYSWQGSPDTDSFGDHQRANGLCAGNISVTSTDANGCSVSKTVTVPVPSTSCVSTVCTGKATITGLALSNAGIAPCFNDAIVSPCPGSVYGYYLRFQNTSPGELFATPCTLQVDLDPNMSFNSVQPSFGCVGATLIDNNPVQCVQWLITDPNDLVNKCVLYLNVDINDIPSSGIWTSTASIITTCASGGATPLVSTVINDGPDQCACDPNDKVVAPEGCGVLGLINDQTLEYKVHFQNLGTGPSHDVVVVDTLDDNLDLNSIQILSSSHTITSFSVDPISRIAVFSFIGIELPPFDLNNDESNGDFTFNIDVVDGLPSGTVISNSAAIFFDANIPVITNEVINTIVDGDVVPSVVASEDVTINEGESTELTATGSGSVPPSEFVWSDGSEGPSITVSPTSSTTFTVNVFASECQGTSDEVNVDVIEILDETCGAGKTLMCHSDGKKEPHTHCVKDKDVDKKLAKGDYSLGSCAAAPDPICDDRKTLMCHDKGSKKEPHTHCVKDKHVAKKLRKGDYTLGSCVTVPQDDKVLMCHFGGKKDPHEHLVKAKDVDKKLAKGDYELGACVSILKSGKASMSGKVKSKKESSQKSVGENASNLSVQVFPNPYND